jgi:hypothetical protein
MSFDSKYWRNKTQKVYDQNFGDIEEILDELFRTIEEYEYENERLKMEIDELYLEK